MFASSSIILNHHDRLINITTSQNIYGRTINCSYNLVHGTIGTMSCCKIGIGGLGVVFFVSRSEMLPRRPG